MEGRLRLRSAICAYLILIIACPTMLVHCEETPCPWKVVKEFAMPSGEAITDMIKAGDTTENAAYTLVLTTRGKLTLYQTYPLRTVRRLGEIEGGTKAVVSRNGSWAAALGKDGVLGWPLDGDSDEKLFVALAAETTEGIDISESGMLAVGGRSLTMLYDFTKGEAKVNLKGVWGTSCKIRGDYAIFGSYNGRVYIYNCKSGELVKEIAVGHNSVVGVDITQDGKTAVAAMSKDNLVHVITVAEEKIEQSLGPGELEFYPGKAAIRSCAIMKDGIFVAASYNGKYLLYDLMFKQMVGFASTLKDDQGNIRLVGERATVFCMNTLTFWENRGGMYNALPENPTLSLLEASQKAEGVRAIEYASDAEAFFIFLHDGKMQRLTSSSKERETIATLPAKGNPLVSPKGKRVLFGMGKAIWSFAYGKWSEYDRLDLVDTLYKFDFVGETRFVVAEQMSIRFFDQRCKQLCESKISFAPDWINGLQGEAVFADKFGRWAVVSLPDGRVAEGKIELGGCTIVGMAHGGLLVLEGIEGRYIRPPSQEALFRVPIAKEVVNFDVTNNAQWIAYCTPTGSYLREIKTGRRWRLPEATDFPRPVFNDKGTRLNFFTLGGIVIFGK